MHGRGLTIAGIVVSVVVMLAALAIVACFVWFALMFIPYGMQLRAGGAFALPARSGCDPL